MRRNYTDLVGDDSRKRPLRAAREACTLDIVTVLIRGRHAAYVVGSFMSLISVVFFLAFMIFFLIFVLYVCQKSNWALTFAKRAGNTSVGVR